jgi:hypothetical protein
METATDQGVPAMRPDLVDLRERVAAAVDDGEGAQREIARLFRVSLCYRSRSSGFLFVLLPPCFFRGWRGRSACG